MELLGDNITAINPPLSETNHSVHINKTFYAMYYGSMVITVFSGLLLNIYVLWLILRDAGSRVGPEFFSLNLALTDILFFTGSLLKPFSIFYQHPTILQTLCFFYGFLITGRPLFEACICVERYLAVLHPVLFLKYKPLRYRLVCSGIIWLITLSSCVILVFNYDILTIFWFVMYVTFFGVMIFCCLAVLRGLCKPGPGDGEKKGGRDDQVKMKAFKIISVLVALQLVTIIIIIFSLYAAFNFGRREIEIINSVGFFIMLSSFLSHPLFYLHKAGKLSCLTTL